CSARGPLAAHVRGGFRVWILVAGSPGEAETQRCPAGHRRRLRAACTDRCQDGRPLDRGAAVGCRQVRGQVRLPGPRPPIRQPHRPMPSSALPQPLSNWRLPALGLAVVLIVVTPFLLLRQAAQDIDGAWTMVAHTYRVEAHVQALASDIRNLEAGVLSLAGGVDTPLLRERIDDSRARITPTLQALEELTRDNPEQHLRLGALQANIAMRKAQAERMIDAGMDATAADIEALVERYPIHDLISGIVAEEQRLLAIRQARAERVERRARIATWTAMAAQLLLLGGVLAYSARQVSHRLRAETSSQRASARASVVLDTVREPIVLADHDLRVVMHNAAFAELYGVSGDARGQRLADIGGGAWRDERTLRRLGD